MSQITFPPDIEYIGDTLPVPKNTKIDIVTNLWRKSENIHMGLVPKKALLLPEEKDLVKIFENFYKKKLYKYKFKGQQSTDVYSVELKNFAKLCWLLNEYYTVGFTSLYSAHYNPRTQKNVIHPGGGRKFIDRFYNKKNHIEMFYFNTMGVQYDFLQDMRVVPYPVLEKMGYDAQLVADHGSIIPHIFWSFNNPIKLDTTTVAMSKHLDYYKSRAENICVASNKILPDYFVKHVNKKHYQFYIEFCKDYSDFLFVKAMFLGIVGLKYADDEIIVTQRSR